MLAERSITKTTAAPIAGTPQNIVAAPGGNRAELGIRLAGVDRRPESATRRARWPEGGDHRSETGGRVQHQRDGPGPARGRAARSHVWRAPVGQSLAPRPQ